MGGIVSTCVSRMVGRDKLIWYSRKYKKASLLVDSMFDLSRQLFDVFYVLEDDKELWHDIIDRLNRKNKKKLASLIELLFLEPDI